MSCRVTYHAPLREVGRLFVYNPQDQLIDIQQQGERISITPNLVSSRWEQLSIADAEGQIALKQQRQLDELGRVVAQLGNAGQQTRIHYDKTGQAVRIDQHSGENKGNNQDNTNNQASAGDPSGVLSTVQHYDSLGRLTQHIDPAQGETYLKHNSNGQIRQVTAANDARTTYIYDGLGQLLQEHSPDTGTRIHHYDTAGQRIRSHGLEQFDQPELSAQHHYDALGRLIHIQYPNSKDDVRYHYDQTGTEDDRNHGIGRLTAIEDRHSRIEYRYDRHGNLLSDHRTLNIDGQSHTQNTRYSYTQGNQLASITYPNGQRIDYLYRQGQADSITLKENRQQKILVSDIQYRPFGPIQQWRNGNGLSQQLEYDLDGRTSAVSVSNSKQEAIWQQHYQYDLLNNITGIERTENRKGTINSQQQQFSYDPVQRLIGDRGNYGEQQFTYDKVGNRLSHVRLKQQPALNDDSYADSQSQIHREDYNYAPASNRLLGTSEKQILLDQAGNLLHESSDRNRAYNYNAQNRISEYVENGQLKARYHYNALGQRVHKAILQADGTEAHTLFHYGQQGELLGETQINNADTSEASHTQNIVWLQMRPVVTLDSSANSTSRTNSKSTDTRISWLHSDHLLTARASTDANQNLIWRWHSDAFGVGEAESFTANGQNNQSTEEEFTLNLRFPGQYHDAESGLHYNYHRTYDPSTGRYIQSDPIGLMGGINTFGYVEGSPVQWADPLGLARLQYILIDNFGGNPTNPNSRTLAPGVDMRLQHFAFYLTDISGASGHSLLYDPNGTFGGLNTEGALTWDAAQLGSTNHWARFQQHYVGQGMATGDWAVINDFDDNAAAALFEALAGYNPLNNQSMSCMNGEALVRNLPDLPQGFYDFENFSFPTYVHFLDQPIFFADQVPSADDPRYVAPDQLPWGSLTFEAEGNDFAGNLYYSRVPHLPPNPSGVTIGRGYDLGQHTAAQIRNILLRTGFPAGNDFNLLVGAAGLRGTVAANYDNANGQALRTIELTREQQYLLFQQTYIEEHAEARRLYVNHIQGGGGPNWENLDIAIRDVLVDMKFRGDFRYVSAGNPRNHPQLSADFRNAVTQNDAAALCRVFADNQARWRQLHIANDNTSGWGVPRERFLTRGEELGGTVVAATQLNCP